ncbi:monovalent cation/H+ antiporter complex subunit F [Brachybacterium sp. AOP43-C2-M15]|uniref:monovalent cation/H+ antiporter complex subunit F n=1 Tax=Brachybacterium sp. AOP43-C2-M15 TaxID=3457661 RepID=UPI004034638A
MILLDIAIGGCVIALLIAALRIIRGPTPADRVVAADLLTFSVVGLIALIGTRLAREGTFDLVLIATLVSFLSAISLARALSRGRR